MYCFQVQNNHYEEFFAPELDKHGYQALYKKRTSEVRSNLYLFFLKFVHLSSIFWFYLFFSQYLQMYPSNPNNIDGCATFFRKDRFTHVKKYEVYH